MRKVGIAALAALSLGLVAQAASAEGFYAGAGLGSARVKADGFKDDDLGFKIFGGYSFNDYLAAEVEYLDGGTAKDDGIKLKPEQFGVSVLGSLPVNETFSLFARVGFTSWEVKQSGGGKEDDEDLLYGLGAALNIGEQFQVRAEYEAVDVDGGDFDFWGVSGVFKF